MNSASSDAAGCVASPLRPCNLLQELLMQVPGIVSITGAGGKTSLLHALGEGLAASGYADGAARRCIKAPARHEPVIPSLTRYVIGILGLSCLNQLCVPERVFRMERFCTVTGLAPGDVVTPEAVARLVAHPEGMFKGAPPQAHKLLFCNQAELSGALQNFVKLVRALSSVGAARVEGCYAGALQRSGLICWNSPSEDRHA